VVRGQLARYELRKKAFQEEGGEKGEILEREKRNLRKFSRWLSGVRI